MIADTTVALFSSWTSRFEAEELGHHVHTRPPAVDWLVRSLAAPPDTLTSSCSVSGAEHKSVSRKTYWLQDHNMYVQTVTYYV